MTKKDLLSALDLEFGADILDSTEYLRKEFLSSIRDDAAREGELTSRSLRFTQDLGYGLNRMAEGVDVFEWVLHEPEVLGDLYKSQVTEGANVSIAQTSSCMFESVNKAQSILSNQHALHEAESNEAVWFIGNLDVHGLMKTDLSSEDEKRKAKLSMLEQLQVFEEAGAHGVWIELDSLDGPSVLYEALRLEGHLPFVLSIKHEDLDQLEVGESSRLGIAIRYDSLTQPLQDIELLSAYQRNNKVKLILEIDSFGMSEHDALDAIKILKNAGISNWRPGCKMTVAQRVQLYAFV